MSDPKLIQVRGPWGVYWLTWWGVLLPWFWVGFFYLSHMTWVLGGVWIYVAWFFPELVGHLRLRVKEPDGAEIIKTASQVPQLVAQMAHASAKWYQGYKGLALLMTLAQAWMAAAVFWAHWVPFGVVSGLLLTEALWTHYWSRDVVG